MTHPHVVNSPNDSAPKYLILLLTNALSSSINIPINNTEYNISTPYKKGKNKTEAIKDILLKGMSAIMINNTYIIIDLWKNSDMYIPTIANEYDKNLFFFG